MTTEAEAGVQCLQAKERPGLTATPSSWEGAGSVSLGASARNQPCLHLDSERVVLGHVREHISVAEESPSWGASVVAAQANVPPANLFLQPCHSAGSLMDELHKL